MKYIFLFLMIFISCKGCYVGEDLSQIEVGEMHDYSFENDIEVNSIDDCAKFVIKHMDEVSDLKKYNIDDYWQLPEESYNDKTGDCEDYCILFMYLLKTKLNIDSNLIMIKIPGDKHALVQITENDYIDLSLGDRENSIKKLYNSYNLISIISYPEVIWMTYHYHNNIGKYL